MVTSGDPFSTLEPAPACTALTTPARWARISFIIFIASITATTCPSLTASPFATASSITSPCIGDRTSSLSDEFVRLRVAPRRGAVRWDVTRGIDTGKCGWLPASGRNVAANGSRVAVP